MEAKPLPNINGDNREFWEACRDHQLKLQRCSTCGHIRAPGSLLCPLCHATESDWITSSGKGKVYTFIVYRVAFHPAFANDLPYVVAVIELEEGPHLLTNVIDSPPEDVACEMEVEVTWRKISDEVTLPLFRPVQTKN